jgi:hypothetical protein
MQILPLFSKQKVLHFNKTDARLANNGISIDLQKVRCRVNFQALKFTPEIESLGYKLVRILQERGPFVALHLRYEMDMLAFLGCTHGCTKEEAKELKRLRFVVLKNLLFFFHFQYLVYNPTNSLVLVLKKTCLQSSSLLLCLAATGLY